MKQFLLKGVFHFSGVCSACNILCESHYLIGTRQDKSHDRIVCRDCFKALTKTEGDKLEESNF